MILSVAHTPAAKTTKDWWHTSLLVANAVVLSLYAYSMCAKAFADYPDGDEAAVMSGLANGDKSYLKGWPAYIRVVQSTAYHVARIRTVRGLQLLGALFAICGAIGINVLTLTQLRLPGPWQILCLSLFNLALILNTEAHKWAAFAILLYPMRIFAGFVFVYVLATYSQSDWSPSRRQTVLLGLAMSLLTFVHPGLIIPECAMAFSLWTTLAIRRQMARHQIRHWALPLVMFLLLPGLVAAAVVLGAPHAEMQTPRDDIRALYFPLNDSYPKTPAGLVEFVFVQLKWLIFYVCLPRSYVHWGAAHSLVSSLPLFLLAAGLARSLVRPAEIRFSVAVFILMDLALRLAADLAGKFPFGGLERYALSQVFGFALMVSLGASDIFLGVTLLASAVSPARIRGLFTPAHASYALAVPILAGALMAGTILAAGTTKSTVSIARDRGEIVDTYGKTKGEAFIVENTTAVVLSYYIGTWWRNENTIIVIPKMYIPREISPAALAGLKNKLSDLSRVQTITRVAFDEPSFREAYHAVDDRFDEVSKRPLLGFWFARWELPEKSSGSKPASPGT